MKKYPFRLFVFILLLFLFFLAAHAASALERITDMDVVATVSADASLLVTEKIAFVAEGDKIRHGLVRVFPLRGRASPGGTELGFRFVSAALDDEPVPFRLERSGANMEIRLGDETPLPPGTHTCLLQYEITGAVQFFPDYDLLNWNVTGDGWDFPIDRAVYRVQLPETLSVLRYECSTTLWGNSRSAWKRNRDGSFETTRPLGRKEGFTVGVSWSKGHVTPPPLSEGSTATVWRQKIPRDRPAGDYLAFRSPEARNSFLMWALLMCAWYIAGYFLPGREPSKKKSFLPDGVLSLEAGALRYIRTLRYDATALSADILDLAIHGRITLHGDRDKMLTLVRRPEAGSKIDKGGEKLLATLFKDGVERLAVSDENAAVFWKALPVMNRYYKSADAPIRRSVLYSSKAWISLAGLLFLVPMHRALKELYALTPYGEPVHLTGVVNLFWQIWILVFVSLGLFLLFRFDFRKKLRMLGNALATLMPALLIAAFLFIGFPAFLSRVFFDPFVARVTLSVSIMTAVCIALMPTRTRYGRELLEQTETIAQRLKIGGAVPPGFSRPVEEMAADELPALFQQFLPEALALDVAASWVDRFKNATQKLYFPWYRLGEPCSWSWIRKVIVLGLPQKVEVLILPLLSYVSMRYGGGGVRSGGRGGGGFGGGFGGGGGFGR